MDVSLAAGERVWALLARSPSELERIPMVRAMPSLSQAPWHLWMLEGCGEVPRTMWALSLVDGRRPSGFGLEASEMEATSHEQVRVRGELWRVLERREAPHIFAAVPLLATPSLRPDELLVLFSDEQALATAARACLVLGQHDLKIGAVAPEPSALPHFVLQVKHPSTFLVETWHAAGLPLYRKALDHLWVAFGLRHPWESGFERLPEPAQRLVLVAPGQWRTLPAPSLRSAWECMESAGDLSTETWETAPQPHFEVPLRWIARREPATPVSWLLDADNLPALETLLSGLSDRDLGNLQLAALRTSDGQTRFVIREAIAGHSSHYLTVGIGLSPVAGVPGLYLPASLGLEPPVPRSELRALFEARGGRVTLVLPALAGWDGDPTSVADLGSQMQVLRFEESAFAPFETLVDHIVEGANEVFEPIVARSTVDLGGLAQLPRLPRPPAVPRRAAERPERPEEPAGPAPSDESTEEEEHDLEPTPPMVPQAPTPEAPADADSLSPQLSEDEVSQRREEDEAEERAIQHLEHADAWAELAHIKRKRGAFADAISCLEHAAWVALEPHRVRLEAELDDWLRELPADAAPALRLRAMAAHFTAAAGDESPEAFGARVAQLVTALRRDEQRLPKRARWRAWKQALTHSPDEVEAARVVDVLLGELSMRGVDEADSFSFARRQIRRRAERQRLEPTMLAPLRRMVDVASALERPDLQLECIGALAAAFDAAGDTDGAEALLGRAPAQQLHSLPAGHGSSAFATCAAAVARSHQGAAELFEGAVERVALMRDGLEKDRALLDLLEQLQQASLIEAEEPLLERFLQVIDQSPPNRQTLQLSDCAPLLTELGAATPTLERLERLLRLPQLRGDAWPLASLLDAMVVCRAGRPPEQEASEFALQALLALPSLDESAARALDHAMTGSPDVAVEAVLQALGDREGLENLLLEGVLIRGLANQTAIDEGFARLRGATSRAWHLPSGPQVAAALRRLVPCAAYLGRPEAGLGIIDEVIQRFGDEHGQRVGPREQGAVLSACAHAAGQLGAEHTSLELLGHIVSAFETLVRGRSMGVAHLFEILGLVVDQVIALGDPGVGLGLIERAVASIAARLENTPRADHPYFLHQARIKCAVAMLSLDAPLRGEALLAETMRDIGAVRQLDAHDRVDLCVDALRALSLAFDDTPAELISLLLDTGLGNGPSGAYGDTLHRTLIRAVVRTLLQRHEAYRLALTKFRAREERVLRRRLLREPLVAP